jgi:pimeloyl-ACP methyl ester carboxylesterase
MNDYGGPIGMRIATKFPNRVIGLIIQNSNAYIEGLTKFWNPFIDFWNNPSWIKGENLKKSLTLDNIKSQYTTGAKNPKKLNSNLWMTDFFNLNRPGNKDIQLELFDDYESNIYLYENWHKYFRMYQPMTLIVWGKNDAIFSIQGALAYKKDLQNVDIYLYNTGHFALQEDYIDIANKIIQFIKQIN